MALRFRRAVPLLGKHACMATVPTAMARTSQLLRLHRNRNSHDDSDIDLFGDRNLVEEAFGWKELYDSLMLGLAWQTSATTLINLIVSIRVGIPTGVMSVIAC